MLKNFIRRISLWTDLALSYVHATLKQAAPFAHGRLLDVGCGRKPYLGIFKPYIKEYIGIENTPTSQLTHDFSAQAADYFYEWNGSLPFPDQSFDTVISISVLEHTPAPAILFAEMARLLKKGGIMIQSVPFSFRLHEEPHDYYRLSKHALRYLSEENGLVVKNILPQGSLWSVIGHKITTLLAFRVMRMAKLAQSMGQFGMEASSQKPPRYWVIPIAAPILLLTVLLVRIMESLLPIHDDTLGFLLIAEKPL
jgi:SAM-dependent methyltransferase